MSLSCMFIFVKNTIVIPALFISLLSFLPLASSRDKYHPLLEPDTSAMFKKYYCDQLTICQPAVHGNPLCAYDDVNNHLVQFDDICTMYKANCISNQKFRQVYQEVCDARNLFDKQYGHLGNLTGLNTTGPEADGQIGIGRVGAMDPAPVPAKTKKVKGKGIKSRFGYKN